MQKSLSTLRLSPHIWLEDAAFDELLQLLEQNPGVFDDIMLFSSFTHAPISLALMRTRCEIMVMRLRKLRELGFGVGINLLCTVGFFPEFIEEIPTGIPHFTYLTGEENPGSFCHNNEIYREEYLKPLLKILAGTKPDFIWLDDDNRGHCACEYCMHDFNNMYGMQLTREELRAKTNSADTAEKLDFRRKYLDFAADSLARHYRCIAETLYSIDPDIELGGMDILGNFSETLDFPAWEEAMSGPGKHPVRWRPGGGIYSDKEPEAAVFRKGVLFGLDAACMPETLTNRQSEIENFVYQRLKKSEKATVFEACVNNAFGMTGTAWNIMDRCDRLQVFDPLLKKIGATASFRNKQVQLAGITPLKGIWNGLQRDAGAWYAIDGSCQWEYRGYGNLNNKLHSNELFASGMPWAFRAEDAAVTLLDRNTVQYMDDKTLQQVLSGGVYCDGGAAEEITSRGFGELLGFKPAGQIMRDMRERLTSHPLNGDSAGFCRDCRQSFTHQPAWVFEPVDENYGILAELIDYRSNTAAACTMGIYTNKLGGRVCVAGYYPFEELQFAYKIKSLKNLFNFLAGGALPAWVASYHRTAVWARESCVNISNLSLDPARDVEVRWLYGSSKAEIMDMYGKTVQLTGTKTTDGVWSYKLPELEPYSISLLYNA